MEDVDDAHASVRTALEALATVELGSLNDTEFEHAYAGLNELQRLDEALAERSCFDSHELAKDTLGEGGDT